VDMTIPVVIGSANARIGLPAAIAALHAGHSAMDAAVAADAVLRTEERDEPPARIRPEQVDRRAKLRIHGRRMREEADPPSDDERIAVADLEAMVDVTVALVEAAAE